MKHYSVIITPQAFGHLENIGQDIRVSLQAPETARRLIAALRKEMQSLSSMPNSIPLTEEEPWRSEGLHKMPVKNYIIYFWVDEANLAVRVTAVIYGRRDQKQALEELKNE